MKRRKRDQNSKDVSAMQQRLVEHLKDIGCIRTSRVEAAFRAVPRHLFLPGVDLQTVYSDQVIPTKRLNGEVVSSSSQPAIMAIMLEQLDLHRGQSVLEIGAGSGYNAALMAHIVGDTGQVITLDIDEDLVEYARKHLAAAGFDRVQVIRTDGGLGYAHAAPYDKIILTVAAWDITPAWQEQLKPEGRIVLPLAIRNIQESVAFERSADHLTSVSIRACGFMVLRGDFAGPQREVELGPERGLSISIDDADQIDTETTYKWLTSPSTVLPTGIRVTIKEIWGGLNLWLSLRESGFCWLTAEGDWVKRNIVPPLASYAKDWKSCFTIGLHAESGLSVFMRGSAQRLLTRQRDDAAAPFDLSLRSFGADNGLAQRLLDHVRAWDAAGRPSTEHLSIRAYPRHSDYAPSANEIVIAKRWTQLVLDWQ